MIKVTASEFAKNFGTYHRTAQHEPVAVTSHGRTTGYFVSEREYQDLKAGKRRVWRVENMPREMIERIAAARVPSKRAQRKALRGED